MTCDRCGKPAVVHEICQHKGQKREVHLCEEHAREAGFELPSESAVTQLVGQFLAAASATPTAPVRAARALPSCAVCKLTFHQFRQSGLLGCPDCYRAFGEPLAALIEKTQNAGVHHVGKAPRRCGGDIDIAMLRQRLARELDEAVRAEQYERAAKLRDRLLTISAEPPGSGATVAKEVGAEAPGGCRAPEPPREPAPPRDGDSGT